MGYFKRYTSGAIACSSPSVEELLQRQHRKANSNHKCVASIKDALIKCQIRDGMTISFHHHLRDGDQVLNMVLDAIAELEIKNLTISASSLLSVHEPLLDHIKKGVVTGIITSGMRGKLAYAISVDSILENPVVFQSHGRRASAIENGEFIIDIAFIAASAADKMGNMSGNYGESAFGSMGYALVDSKYAKKVVCITDNLVDYPLASASIDQTYVDYVVVTESIGDNKKISGGATRITHDPKELKIAENAANALICLGAIKNNFSFQAGSGGASLAVIQFLKEYMTLHGITGSFMSGGINKVAVDLLQEGYFKALLDTQTFDGDAVKSFRQCNNYIEMSAAMYASPTTKGCVSDLLDIVILSATEVDLDFNVNVLTSSKGIIMGAIGGHPDIADGSKLTVVTIPLTRKQFPIVRDKVTHVVTPGHYIDLISTEIGIAVNPKRTDLLEKLRNSGIPVYTIEELKKKAYEVIEPPKPAIYTEKVVGIIEDRFGNVQDVVRQVVPFS